MNFKTSTKSYKCKKAVYNGPDKLAVFEGAHEAEQKALRESAGALADTLERQKDETLNVGRFMEVVHRYMTFEELTPAMLREFVEKIIVHEPETIDGERHQEIEIVYNFVCAIELAAMGQQKEQVSA